MSKKVDTGKFFKVKYFSINLSDDVKTLMEKAYIQMFGLFKSTLKNFQKKKINLIIQERNGLESLIPKKKFTNI